MPKIEQYTARENAAGPQGAISPNLDLVGAAGRGIEHLGKEISGASDVMFRRQVQLQDQIAYEDVTDRRMQYFQDLQDQIQKGTVDATSIGNQIDEHIRKVPESLTTGPAQDTWTRGMIRSKGEMMRAATRAQVAIAANNAQVEAKNSISNLANTTQINPSTFQDSMEHLVELAHKTIPVPDQAQFLADGSHEIAKAHILGTANPQGANDPDTALTLLKNPEYAKYIKSGSYNPLVQQVQNLKDAKKSDADAAVTQAVKTSEIATRKYLTDNFQKMFDGTIGASDIIANAPKEIDGEGRKYLLQFASNVNSLATKTNPRALGDAMDRIGLPTSDPDSINSVKDIMKLQGQGIGPRDVEFLTNYFLKSDKGGPAKVQNARMWDSIKGRMLPPKDVNDPDAMGRASDQFNRFLKLKDQMAQDGKDTAGLSDLNSPDSFLKSVPYWDSRDAMKRANARLKSQVTGQPPPAQDMITAQPGVSPVQAQAAAVEMKQKGTGKVGIWQPDPSDPTNTSKYKFIKWKQPAEGVAPTPPAPTPIPPSSDSDNGASDAW